LIPFTLVCTGRLINLGLGLTILEIEPVSWMTLDG
jgi:hypothetical protein